MDLEEFILEKLIQDKNVVIQYFGKLYVKFYSAEIQPDTNFFFPPKYKVEFSQQYDLNDTSTYTEYAQINNIPLEEATQLIDKRVKEWKNTLKTSQNLMLKDLGSFSIDKENIRFRMSNSNPILNSNFGLPLLKININNL